MYQALLNSDDDRLDEYWKGKIDSYKVAVIDLEELKALEINNNLFDYCNTV